MTRAATPAARAANCLPVERMLAAPVDEAMVDEAVVVALVCPLVVCTMADDRTEPLETVAVVVTAVVMVAFTTTMLRLLVVMLDVWLDVVLDGLVLVVLTVGETTTAVVAGLLMLDAVVVVAPARTHGTMSM